jgi:hypothetical protein
VSRVFCHPRARVLPPTVSVIDPVASQGDSALTGAKKVQTSTR